jgi:hypothetical protein
MGRPLAWSAAIRTFSIASTPRIVAALLYVFSAEHAFFSSIEQCGGLVELGYGDDAAARARRHACQHTAVVLRYAVAKCTRAVEP